MSSRSANFQHLFNRYLTLRFLNARCSKSLASRAARLAVDDSAVSHFVDPIAGFGDNRVVRG